MKKIMIMLFALLMTACMQEPQTDMQGLQAMGNLWQSAFDSKDAGALAAIYSEDGAVLPPNSETVSGRAAIQAFATEVHASGISFEIKDTEVYRMVTLVTRLARTQLPTQAVRFSMRENTLRFGDRLMTNGNCTVTSSTVTVLCRQTMRRYPE